MEIIFEGPIFFAQEDENHFFEWLYSLPAYKEIVGSGVNLTLELNDPVDDDSILQLLIIFRRWCIDTNALFPLKRESNENLILWDTELVEAVK